MYLYICLKFMGFHVGMEHPGIDWNNPGSAAYPACPSMPFQVYLGSTAALQFAWHNKAGVVCLSMSHSGCLMTGSLEWLFFCLDNP